MQINETKDYFMTYKDSEIQLQTLNDTEALLDAEVSGVFGGMCKAHEAKLLYHEDGVVEHIDGHIIAL